MGLSLKIWKEEAIKSGSPYLKLVDSCLANSVENIKVPSHWHSEQWILQWLEHAKGQNFQVYLDQLIAHKKVELKEILENKQIKADWSLSNFVLHVHSSQAVC